jgi:hypothetical protein
VEHGAPDVLVHSPARAHGRDQPAVGRRGEHRLTRPVAAVLDDAGDVVGGALNEARARRTVGRSAEPLADTVTSPDGFLSGKDSGSMLYVVRLA